MRICFYTQTALPTLGGQQLVVDRLARELTSLGHRVTVLAPGAPHPSDPDHTYRVVRHPRFLSTVRLVAWYRRHLLRLWREEHFDLIHAHSLYPTGWIAGLARERMGVPVVVTSHGGDVAAGGLMDRKPRLRRRYVQAIRTADALVTISRFTRDALVALDPAGAPAKVVDIPNGVDVSVLRDATTMPPGLNVTGPYVLYLGRTTRAKGVDLAADASRGFPDDVKLVIAGDGPERPTGPRVVALGRQDQSAKVWLLQNALCTLVPSRGHEAFGLTALESMAAGRPVVASDLPGLADLVGDAGIVIPAGSSTAIATAVRQLRDNPRQADETGRVGQRRAAAYDWPIIARRHVELYARLLAKSPS